MMVNTRNSNQKQQKNENNKEQGVHDGKHIKAANKNNRNKKNNLRGTSKGSKKLQSRRTVCGAPAPSPIEKSTLAESM